MENSFLENLSREELQLRLTSIRQHADNASLDLFTFVKMIQAERIILDAINKLPEPKKEVKTVSKPKTVKKTATKKPKK